MTRPLLLLLGLEIAVFSFTGTNFWSIANGFEIVRLGAELGLLALALTPVLLTGGIDLSVGSMMGLCAVAFGALWHDRGLPAGLCVLLALAIGVAGGALNALLIARFRITPLIVTLGTYSLFRGIAEGLTGGAVNYTGFPASFLFLGQGYIGGVVPAQFFVLVAVAVAYWVLVHRSVIGRTLSAIGFSAEGARYAGIPVSRRLALIYVLSGVTASLTAVIYVSHLGQAKSDAGSGYELIAITAVVLGGTSIFGGRGSVIGTLLGLFAIVILQNGLRLSALPAELTGVLIGIVLIGTILLDRAPAKAGSPTNRGQLRAILALGLLTFITLMGVFAARTRRAPATGHRTVVGLMPKAKGDPYFVSCRKGAEEAALALGIDLIWDGPTELDPAKQNEVVEGWITKGVDVIAVSVENRAAISTVLRKARSRGIRVIAWDADAEPDARDYFVNQATPEGIGYALADQAAKELHDRGEFAIITGALSSANQNEWIKHIKARIAEKYPGLKLLTIEPSDDDRDKAFARTQTVLKVYPDAKLIMGIAAPAVPGAAEAVKQSGRADVKVIGLSLPSLCRPYVHAGIIDAVILWNTYDLGYLTLYVADGLASGRLRPGSTSLEAGRVGKVEIRGDQVILGAPFTFTKDNIDKFEF
jgi:rhamnose transport system substrate-binding protein